MQALTVTPQHLVEMVDVPAPGPCGPNDVRIAIRTVGICGSDVHYVTHGRIGPYVVNKSMILGHEASGVVLEVGANVRTLIVGDRVCMEPGIPNPTSKAARLGLYNVDPEVVFWATPPIDGCLLAEVVHPAAFTFKLPDHVSFAEGALIEPFAIGMQAATKAKLKPGDIALVIGAGTIGVMSALAALAGGAAKVIVADIVSEKLTIIGAYPGVVAINSQQRDLKTLVEEETNGWGVNIVFEASGAPDLFSLMFDLVCPGGAVVLVGIPANPAPFDVAAAQAKEARVETVFRYANMYERALMLVGSGKVDLKPLISATYPFEDGVQAFARAIEQRPGDVKIQISMPTNLDLKTGEVQQDVRRELEPLPT